MSAVEAVAAGTVESSQNETRKSTACAAPTSAVSIAAVRSDLRCSCSDWSTGGMSMLSPDGRAAQWGRTGPAADGLGAGVVAPAGGAGSAARSTGARGSTGAVGSFAP